MNAAVCRAQQARMQFTHARSDARYEVRVPISVWTQPTTSQPTIPQPPRHLCEGSTLDISNAGLTLLVPVPFAVGRIILIDLTHLVGSPAAVHVLIRSHTRLLPRVYSLGTQVIFDLGVTQVPAKPTRILSRQAST